MTDLERVINTHLVQECLFDQPGAVLGNDEHLVEEGILDSLGIFVLIAFLEKQFAIKVQPEDIILANFKTVRAIAGMVAAKLSAAGPQPSQAGVE
jgi:acyl carrier protein